MCSEPHTDFSRVSLSLVSSYSVSSYFLILKGLILITPSVFLFHMFWWMCFSGTFLLIFFQCMGKKILGHCFILLWKSSPLDFYQTLGDAALFPWIMYTELCMFECREDDTELRHGGFLPDSEDTASGRRFLVFTFVLNVPKLLASYLLKPSKVNKGQMV